MRSFIHFLIIKIKKRGGKRRKEEERVHNRRVPPL
jgi:hypothetical protein